MSLFFITIAFFYSYAKRNESFDQYPSKTPKMSLNMPCMTAPTKRYMYQAIPPARNSLQDIRSNAAFTPAVSDTKFGIFQHTGLFGNYTNQRVCPNFKSSLIDD